MNALNSGNCAAAGPAVTTILDNIILHLDRYDLVKAQTLAEVLVRDRMPTPRCIQCSPRGGPDG